MTELVRIPLADGDSVLAEVDVRDLPGEAVELAGAEPGRAVATLSRTLEESLDSLSATVTGLVRSLRAAGPESFDVEFGVKLGGETGVILAKGTGEVSFTVTLHWSRRSERPPAPGATPPSGAAPAPGAAPASAATPALGPIPGS